ncbi:MAG: WD40 repeat domain-containing protein [Polyangiaceae bacterium]
MSPFCARGALLAVLALLIGCAADSQQTTNGTSTRASSSTTTVGVEPREPPPRVLGDKFVVDPHDPLPSGAVARCGTSLWRAPSEEHSFTVTEDGGIWITIGYPTRLRNIATGVETEIPDSLVTVLPDGKAALLRRKGALVVFDLEKKSVARVLDLSSVTTQSPSSDSVRLSPGGSTAVLQFEKTLHVVDLTTGQLARPVSLPDSFIPVSVADGGARILLVRFQDWAVLEFRVVEVATGKVLAQADFQKDLRQKPDQQAYVERMSPRLTTDGSALYFIERTNKSFNNHSQTFVRVDAKTGKRTASTNMETANYARDFSLSVDGKLAHFTMPFGDFDRWTVLDLQTSQFGPWHDDNFVGVSADGRRVAVREGDRVHFSGSDAPAERPGYSEAIKTVALLDGGRALLTVGNREPVRLWDTSSCELKHEFSGAFVEGVSDRTALLSFEGERVLRVIDADGKVTELGWYDQSVLPLVLSHDGATGYAWRGSRLISVDLKTGQDSVMQQLDASVGERLLLSPSGARIALGDSSKLLVLDAKDGRVLATTERDTSEFGFSFVGENLIVDCAAKSLFEVPTLSKRPTSRELELCIPMGDAIGRHFVTWAREEEEPTLQLWDAQSREVVSTLSGHRGPITTAVFTRASDYLVTGSRDTTVLIWDLKKVPSPPTPPR